MNKFLMRLCMVVLAGCLLCCPVYAAEDGEADPLEAVETEAAVTEDLTEAETAEPETVTETETSVEETETTVQETETETAATEAETEPQTEAVIESDPVQDAKADPVEEMEETVSDETSGWEIIYPDTEVGSITDSDLTSGLVEVYLGYAFPDGSFDIWYACPGFSVNRNTVVTSDRILLSAPDNERYVRIVETRSEGYMNLGIDLSEFESLKKELQYRVFCGGILIPAGMIANQDGIIVLDVSANLTSSYKFSNEKASFDDKIYAIGVLDRIITGNDQIGRANILEQTIQISSISADGTIQFSFGSHEYFVGGPLVSETGAVLGIVTNTGEGIGESIPKERIQELLDSENRPYEVGEKRILAEYSALRAAVNEAGKVDKTMYSEESVKILESAVDEGRGLLSLNDRYLDQRRIDRAAESIRSAISKLEEVEQPKGFPIWLAVVFAGVLLATAAVVIITVKLVSKKKADEDDYEYLQDNRSGFRKAADTVLEKIRSMKLFNKDKERKPQTAAKKHAERAAKKTAPKAVETAKLQEPATEIREDEEATVLVSDDPLKILRKTTGEVITIDSFPFVFGHSNKYANFILDGKTVSRKHFVLDRTVNGTVIIRDLHSTNGTSLNGVKIDPDKDETLAEEDVIVIPGEEFQVLEGVS